MLPGKSGRWHRGESGGVGSRYGFDQSILRGVPRYKNRIKQNEAKNTSSVPENLLM